MFTRTNWRLQTVKLKVAVNDYKKYELQQFVMLCHVTGVFIFTELPFDFFLPVVCVSLISSVTGQMSHFSIIVIHIDHPNSLDMTLCVAGVTAGCPH